MEASKQKPIDVLKNFVVPALKERLVLIIEMADEILDNQKISDGYKKIYSHVYKNTPDKSKSKDDVIQDMAQDLANIYAGYYFETKNPETIVPADVLHMFHFSLLRDLYLPSPRFRKVSTLITQKAMTAKAATTAKVTKKKTKVAPKKQKTSKSRATSSKKRKASRSNPN